MSHGHHAKGALSRAPPSPTAPRRSRFRNPRVRVATGAAVISLALATALGPAAADELLSDDAPVSTEVVRSESPVSSTTEPQEMAQAEKGPSQRDKEVLVLTLIKQQRDADAAFQRLAEHEAAEAARQQEAAEAEAAAAAAREEAAAGRGAGRRVLRPQQRWRRLGRPRPVRVRR